VDPDKYQNAAPQVQNKAPLAQWPRGSWQIS
jgi:hypothetical protein